MKEKIIEFCSKIKIEKLFLLVAIPLSLMYALLVLPLNVPDEGTHLIKAYDISIGHIVTQIDEEGKSYAIIPRELENYSYMRFQNYKDVFNELQRTTDYKDQVRTVCAAQGNSPFLYVGSVMGFLIGRIFGINLFYVVYLSRIINIVIYLVFGYLTIKKVPFGKLVMVIYLCMPMMLQQAASCSADAILNATLIYYIAHLLYLTFKETELTKKDKIILYVYTALIAMFKYVYILVAGILFITLFNKKIDKKQKIKTVGIMLLIGSMFAVGWYVFTTRYKSAPDVTIEYNRIANVDTSRQIAFIKENPVKFLGVLAREYIVYGPEYVFGAVGNKLGWLDVNVNMGIIVLYIIILLLSVVSEKSKFELNKWSKIWIIAIILAISALLKISMYVFFTPVGLERVCGVQGRYYTPILFLVLYCVTKKDNSWKIKNLNKKSLTDKELVYFLININKYLSTGASLISSISLVIKKCKYKNDINIIYIKCFNIGHCI